MSFIDLHTLNEKICTCQLCPLSINRTFAVPGSGPSPAQIMLVGEAPGREEDLKGLPFVGRAGRLLDKALLQAGLERSEVFITSVVKCRPPENRKPKKEEIELCHPYLQAQMDLVHPENCLPDGKHGNSGSPGHAGRYSVAWTDPSGPFSYYLSSRCGLEEQKSDG